MREPKVTIILPNGDSWHPERRAGAAAHRPYAAHDGPADDADARPAGGPPRDRRRRKRPAVDGLRGRRYDLEA